MNTRDTILNAITATIGIDRIEDSQTLADLGADSLDAIEIAMAVENATGMDCHLPDAIIETGTVAQIIAAVDAALGKE